MLAQQNLPFETIILHAHSIEYVLEQLEESVFQGNLGFIVVGSEPLPKSVRQLNLRITLWDDLEKQGRQGTPVHSDTPGALRPYYLFAWINKHFRARRCVLCVVLLRWWRRIEGDSTYTSCLYTFMILENVFAHVHTEPYRRRYCNESAATS